MLLQQPMTRTSMTSLAKEALTLHPTPFRLEVVQDSVLDRVAHRVVDKGPPKVVDRVHQSPLQAHNKVCKLHIHHAHVMHVSDPTLVTAT